MEPAYYLGNINDTPMIELVSSPQQRKFGQDKLDTLPRYCRECAVRFACHGGCPKDRFMLTPDGETGLNYLCAGYMAFFKHVDRPMRTMAELLRRDRAPAEIMRFYAAEDAKLTAAFAKAGRNDPCPCGAGRSSNSVTVWRLPPRFSPDCLLSLFIYTDARAKPHFILRRHFMLLVTGLILLGLGIAVWLYGNRMWLLGAGAGALLGMALLNLIPVLATGGLDLLIVGGLAILFGVLGFVGKAFAKLIAMVIGFIAGGAIVLGFLGLFGVTTVGFWVWILAVIGGAHRGRVVRALP